MPITELTNVRDTVLSIIQDETGARLDELKDEARLGLDLGLGNTIGQVEFLQLWNRLIHELGLPGTIGENPFGISPAEITIGEVITAVERAIKSQNED